MWEVGGRGLQDGQKRGLREKKRLGSTGPHVNVRPPFAFTLKAELRSAATDHVLWSGGLFTVSMRQPISTREHSSEFSMHETFSTQQLIILMISIILHRSRRVGVGE